MVSMTDEILAVVTNNWSYALVVLVSTVILIGWAMYQLSKSLHIAFAVTIGVLLVAAVTLYAPMRVVSSVSLVLAIGLALFYVVNQWLMGNKTVKEQLYDVEEKR